MLLTTLAFAQGIANVMNNLNYQIVGIMVVMMCLGGLAVILTISGSIAAAIQNRAKAKTAAPVAVPAAAPAAAGKPGMTPEMLAILSAGAYAAQMSSNYNSRPRVPELMIADGRTHVVRARETVAGLFASERTLDGAAG